MYIPFQLIYDFKDGGATFDLISLHPDQISDEDVAKFRKIGVEIPSMMYVVKATAVGVCGCI